MTTAHHALAAAALFVAGSAFGSFLNVVLHRLPAGKSLFRPASACPACARPIAWFDNVPVLAWLWLGGRCRRCRAPIPGRYPAVEALCGLLASAVYLTASFRAGGDLLDTPGGLGSLGLRLTVALGAASAGWLAAETARPGISRAAAWGAVAPSLAAVAWALLAP
jgi:prepilin signal peptidase PulO-like enzyme (type II secretory pathway)